MIRRSVLPGKKRQRRRGLPRRLPPIRRSPPRSKSAESFARSATETRDIKALFIIAGTRRPAPRRYHSRGWAGQLFGRAVENPLCQPFQTRCVEAIEAAESRISICQMRGQAAQIAGGREKFGKPAYFGGGDGQTAQRRFALQERCDLIDAFFRLHGADAIDERAAGFHQRGGAVEQTLLERSQDGEIGFALEPGYVR